MPSNANTQTPWKSRSIGQARSPASYFFDITGPNYVAKIGPNKSVTDTIESLGADKG